MPNKNSKRLIKSYGSVKTHTFYIINNKVLFPQNETAIILGVTTKSLSKYREKWLKEDELSLNLLPLFDIVKAVDGYRENVDTKHRSSEPKVTDKSMPEDVAAWIEQMEKWDRVPLTLLPKDEIERRISVKEYTMIDIKARLVTEEVIESDKVDFAKAEVAVTILSHLRSLKKLLPPLVNPQKPHIVTPILDREFKQSVTSMHNFVNMEIPEEHNFKFWDVIETVTRLLKDGNTPKELIKRLDG